MSMVTAAPHKSLATHPDFAPASERPYEWRDDAACKTVATEVFFPPPVGRNVYDEARAVCESCPVRQECLDMAVRLNVSDGFFGGLTPAERGQVRSRRRMLQRECIRCGEAFTGPYTVHYCSDECRYAVRSVRMRGPRAGRFV